jgi:large subunit ribosomal protein L17
MRHGRYGGKLGRTGAHRDAMFRNLVTSLLEHERVRTTDAKARQIRRIAERMITLGKRGDLHARRRAAALIRSREVTAKVFGPLAERFRARPGGYTRVLKLGRRVGDAAPLAIVELVEAPESARGKGRAEKGAAAPKAREAKAPRSEAKAGKAKPRAAEKPAARRKAPRKQEG